MLILHDTKTRRKLRRDLPRPVVLLLVRELTGYDHNSGILYSNDMTDKYKTLLQMCNRDLDVFLNYVITYLRKNVRLRDIY